MFEGAAHIIFEHHKHDALLEVEFTSEFPDASNVQDLVQLLCVTCLGGLQGGTAGALHKPAAVKQ